MSTHTKQGVGVINLTPGVGVIKYQPGGVVDQGRLLTMLEDHLDLGATATAVVLGTNPTTYKFWKAGKRNMTGPTLRFVSVLFAIKGTPLGEQYGI